MNTGERTTRKTIIHNLYGTYWTQNIMIQYGGIVVSKEIPINVNYYEERKKAQTGKWRRRTTKTS